MWTKKEAARHLDAHAGDWEKSQDRGALVREDDSEDGEGGLFASLPFPSGKDPPNKAPAKTSDGFRFCCYGYPWSTCQLGRDGGAAIGEFGGTDGLNYCEHHAGSEHALTKGGCRGDIHRNACTHGPHGGAARATHGADPGDGGRVKPVVCGRCAVGTSLICVGRSKLELEKKKVVLEKKKVVYQQMRTTAAAALLADAGDLYCDDALRG